MVHYQVGARLLVGPCERKYLTIIKAPIHVGIKIKTQFMQGKTKLRGNTSTPFSESLSQLSPSPQPCYRMSKGSYHGIFWEIP